MGNEEYLKKIAEELERLNNDIEKSLEKQNEESVLHKERTVFDEIREWLDIAYRDILLKEAQEFSKYMMSTDEPKEQDLKRFVFKIASFIKLKKSTEQYLSEDGILRLDDELSKEMVQDD